MVCDLSKEREQYPEYYELFGTVDRQTPDQEYHCMIEKENREWWERRDGKEPRVFAHGEAGRVELYSVLAAEIEKTESSLEANKIHFDPMTKDTTTKALLLFWKMQWQDRPGLSHLCERSETEDYYLKIRYDLFLNETPEVRARYLEILKPVAYQLWKNSDFRKYTRNWSMANRKVLRFEEYISTKAMDGWVCDLAAELIVELVSKIGIVRALQVKTEALNHVWAPQANPFASSYIRRDWIKGAVLERLGEILGDVVTVLKSQAPHEVFQHGTALGLRSKDVIADGVPMFDIMLRYT